jgi:hypothetical protein
MYYESNKMLYLFIVELFMLNKIPENPKLLGNVNKYKTIHKKLHFLSLNKMLHHLLLFTRNIKFFIKSPAIKNIKCKPFNL